jgi:hypothetical protein
MAHAFRGIIHRCSSDHDGEFTLTLKIPSMYRDDVNAVSTHVKEILYFTVMTEDELHTQEDTP